MVCCLVEHALEATSRPGDLVIDPFAGQAALPRAALVSRRRILLGHASPVALLSVLTSASHLPAVLDAAFSPIADALRRGQTLVITFNGYTKRFARNAPGYPSGLFIWIAQPASLSPKESIARIARRAARRLSTWRM